MALSGEYRLAFSLPPDNDVSRSGGCATSLSDRHLVLAARSGSRSAFNELWNLYSRRVYSTVFNVPAAKSRLYRARTRLGSSTIAR